MPRIHQYSGKVAAKKKEKKAVVKYYAFQGKAKSVCFFVVTVNDKDPKLRFKGKGGGLNFKTAYVSNCI